MSREWCPTLVSNSRLLDTAHGGKTCEISSPNNADIARENGAVAANSDVSAHKFASTLRDRIRDNSPKFRACVVASKINKDFWPIAVRHTCFVYDDDFRPKPDAAVSLGGRFMFELLHTESSVQNVVLPSDQIIKFLDDVARREAKVKSHSFSSNAYNLVLLPTLGKNASLDSILGCISGNHRLLESLKSLSVCTATASEEAAITAFSEKAKKLTGVSYARCALRNCAIGAFQAWKESTIEQVNVEGNDLGTNMEDGMHEEIAASIAEFVKYNKFLLKLNLAHNNFNGEAISSVMQSLFKSDTVLLPDDLPPEPEEDDPPVEEYIDRSLFIPSDEDEEDEMTEEEEEEEEEAEASDASASNEEMEEEPAASLKKTKKKRRSSDSDEESDEDEDDEEESEGDGNDEGNGSDDGEEDSEEDEEDDGPKVDPKIARKYARLFKRLLRDEGRLRRECVLEYLDSLLVTISEIDAIRARRDDEKRRAIEAFCERRSGWSHLQTLILRGNPIGDRATAEVASTLKDEVLLEDEEIERIENKLRDGVSVLLEDHQSDRRQTMVSEMKEWRMLTSEARREQKSISYNATDHPVFPDEMEDDDEYERNAPPVVLTNDGMDEGDEEFDEELPELDNDWEEDRESWNIPVEPKKSGMNTLRYLDLGSCEVGSRGVKALATVLMTNTVLETLILRNNSKIGTMFKKIVDENSDDDDGDTAPRKVEVPHYISPGFGAFTDMLRTNSSLRQLDLGYCQLSPDAIRILGAALAANESIVTLCMEGNRFVETAPEDAVTATLQPSESALLSFLHGVEKSSVQHLSLSHNDLASCIWQEEVDALASLSKKLSSLYLTSVGMTADHISKWAAALSNDQESVVETLHIARNSFHSQQCGQAIATLLSQFPQLKELCIDDHPKLGSAGLGAALATAPSTLVRLSCDRTGVSAKRYAGQLVLEPKLCSQLEYLCLSDTNISTYEELQEWAVHLSEHCHKLQFLSIWTRRLDMEPNLEPLRALVEAIPSLQHIDFGVLLRFDVSPDYTDDLGAIEKALVNRRLAQHEVRIEPPATTELPEPTVAQQSE